MDSNKQSKMMDWRAGFALFLIGLSVLFYVLHYLLFRDMHHIMIYLIGDIAFVPISVLMVTLVLDRIFDVKQKETLLHKLNMVVGTFFSETGNALIREMDTIVTDNPGLREKMKIASDWTDRDFAQARAFLAGQNLIIDIKKIDLTRLRDFLLHQRMFMLTLLENPNLLEHDRITDMLWAIFHLTEELGARKSLVDVAARDAEHIAGDIKRVFTQLIRGWLDYMKYLRRDYPYLYSLAVRMNPFCPDACAELR